MNMKNFIRASAAVIALFTPTLAFAHHSLGGMPMVTFADGLLSGVGHPLLGFDHLFFVALVGIAAIYTKQRFTSPMVYIVAMLFGCYAMSTGIGLPAKEVIIGLFLLTLGAVVLPDKALSLLPAIAIFAGFGLFHGSAFGDALASQEAGIGGQVLIGYLVGLSAIQYAIALGAGWLVANVLGALTAQAIQARLAGAVVAGVGLFLTLENVEGIVFDLMGWTS